MSTGKVAVFHGPGKPFEIREVPIPEVEPDAVLIRVSLANVCGSDLHFWRGDAPLKLPPDGWIFGHEMTGRVAKLGARVSTDSLGRPLASHTSPLEKINDAFAQSEWHTKDTTNITRAAIVP
jgi:D-arabinose 1-dehydrogenase-like Zn-dependent alcohol dehydrogenase